MQSFTPIFQDDILIDIETTINDRPVRMLGKAGAAREEAILAPLKNTSPDNIDGVLPVLLGAGLGHALKALLAATKGPIAVVDKESELFSLSEVREKYPDPRIFWLIVPEGASPKAIFKALIMWQVRHEDKPFALLAHPFYQRLDPWYQEMRQCINNSKPNLNVWKNAQTPRFAKSTPRILFLTTNIFFLRDLANACEECQYEYDFLNLETFAFDQEVFMLTLLQKVTNYKPDYLVTINHAGVDHVGILNNMLERMQIPLASWFLDDPLYYLPWFVKEKETNDISWYTIFTWNADTVPTLKTLGHKHVFYLPLGTNPDRFSPHPKQGQLYDAVCRDITFVGNSSVGRINQRLAMTTYPQELLHNYIDIAKAFSESQEHSVGAFLHTYSPELAAIFCALSKETRLLYENIITWSATQQYRTACIKATLPFNPLIVGDEGWFLTLKHAPKTWEHRPKVSYTYELPRIYPYSTINFNTTCKQMKGAVNQRVFDVPAAGSFVLTDWQEQMDDLLERDKEIIAYHAIEEIPELIRFYLKNDTARETIITAGRKRVLGEHTWTHRVRTMIEKMNDIYGT